jgi:DNA polymerase III subunit alpha
MPIADFVHLRVHTPFSLLEGAVKIPELVSRAVANDMPALAITDTGNMFGVLEFSAACAGKGVQPIIGTLLAISSAEHRTQRPEDAERLVLLAQDDKGYANLLKLVSKSHLETEAGDVPAVDMEALGRHAEGLICLTGGPNGPVARRIVEGREGDARTALNQLKTMFGDRLYVELQRHDEPAERQSEAVLVNLAYDLDLPLVATNDVMFTEASMHEAHDALTCIAGGATVNRTDRRRVSPQHYFKTAEEMRYKFSDLPEACDNTLVIARRCAVMSPKRKPILPRYPDTEGRSEEEELRRQATEGLDARLEAHVFTSEMDAAERETVKKQYHDRLDFELNVIIGMQFPGYFLIVAEFIKWAKAQGIPVGPGRGSGAGSVVAWALTITDLDPIRFGLLFERFLNPERVSMPDFDVDFCQDRRDEVIAHVQELYGRDRVAQIITFGTLQARAVVRDVGRVLEMPYGQVDRLAKLVPVNPANPISLQDALNSEEGLRDARAAEPAVARLIDTALKLEGLYRHASTHAAGVVIGDRPLDELVPLYRDPRSDMPVTQFHMKDVEKAGLVKFDFLGLKTLTVLQRAVELLAKNGIEVDLDTLPLDDPATYAMLTRTETVGVFQLEGQGMRDALRQLRPDKIEDIIALVSLYRPGPMENIPLFCRRKHGDETVDYMHPMLEPALAETYGVIIYQEQVMQIAQILAGYSLGEADLLRRAMGKKIKEEMAAQRDRFVTGAVAKGVDERQASNIFDLVDKFAGYGFNKSHAAAYALVAYQTAWLKANHPVEFLAASMTLDMGNTDKLNIFKQELDRLQIPLLPPDVNSSGVTFTVELLPDGTKAVRYALAAVKNVGAHAMEDLVAERERLGPFTDLFDFTSRLDTRVMNKRQIENLARAGAFDGLEENRAKVVANVELLVRYNGVIREERESQQSSLFGGESAVAPATPALTEVDPWITADALKEEFDAIGFHLSSHPLAPYQDTLDRLEVVTFVQAEEQARERGTSFVKLAGIPVSRRERTSASGNRFAFAVISDLSGSHEMVLFSDVLAASRDLLDAQKPVLIEAEVRIDGETAKVSARRLVALDEAAALACAAFRVEIGEKLPVERLSQVLERAERGRGRIQLSLQDGAGHAVEIALPGGFALSPGLRAQIEALPGVAMVADSYSASPRREISRPPEAALASASAPR